MSASKLSPEDRAELVKLRNALGDLFVNKLSKEMYVPAMAGVAKARQEIGKILEQSA